jgi:hypothetical protein
MRIAECGMKEITTRKENGKKKIRVSGYQETRRNGDGETR